ncbi:uncharacterized protein LAESUDRAFT_667911, partial [Laetiporus sulphureus 93-53]
ALHRLWYHLVGCPAPDSQINKWKCPVVCWLALSSVKADGRFMDAAEYTPLLARWEYLMRQTQLYHATIVYQTQPQPRIKEFDEILAEFCKKNLIEGVPSPYNTVREHQHFASALVKRTAAPPRITWSPDMAKITCDGHTLEMACLRSGLNAIATFIEDHFQSLLLGNTIKPHVPEDMVEDMADKRVGLSWVEKPNLLDRPYPLLEILQHHPDYKICYIDAQENFHWNRAGMIAARQEFSCINEALSILCFMLPAPPPRGTEFTDTRLRNAQIQRNIYKDHGTWIVHIHVKTSSLTQSLSWIPTLCPKRLSTLLDFYCLVIRPIEVLIAHEMEGEAGVLLHHEFLFCQDGHHIDSRHFSRSLERFSERYMKEAFTIHTWRHMAIAIQREFLGDLDLSGDHMGDLLSNHGTAQARKTYAREHGDLPFLTSDAMWDSRLICEQWHDILGWGKNIPPLPKRLYRSAASASIIHNPASPSSSSQLNAVNLENLVNAAVKVAIGDLKFDIQNMLIDAIAHHSASNLVKEASSSNHALIHQASIDQHSSISHLSPVLQSPPHHQAHFSVIDEVEALYAGTVDAQPSPRVDWYTSYNAFKDALGSRLQLSTVDDQQTSKCLRVALKDNNAQFKSTEQLKLLHYVLQAECHIVAVLPTGGGKSLAWEVPSMLKEKKTITVILIPFLPLIHDMLRRAQQKGISACKWNPMIPPSNDVRCLFASYECVGSKQFIWYVLNSMHHLHCTNIIF